MRPETASFAVFIEQVRGLPQMKKGDLPDLGDLCAIFCSIEHFLGCYLALPAKAEPLG
jgi:hypothetical protein